MAANSEGGRSLVLSGCLKSYSAPDEIIVVEIWMGNSCDCCESSNDIHRTTEFVKGVGDRRNFPSSLLLSVLTFLDLLRPQRQSVIISFRISSTLDSLFPLPPNFGGALGQYGDINPGCGKRRLQMARPVRLRLPPPLRPPPADIL